jgi:hypothetical protein
METKIARFIVSIEIAIAALLMICCFPPGLALAQAPFYQSKTITVVQGRDPGGTGDIRVRAVLPFLQKYIPGNPTIVNEYMPGGGSRKAANHIFKSAQQDGLTIGNLGSGMVAAAVLGDKGVLYDLDAFFYLGSPFSSHQSIFVTRKDAGWSDIEKLRSATGIRIGGQSVGFSTYIEGRLFAYTSVSTSQSSSPVMAELSWIRRCCAARSTQGRRARTLSSGATLSGSRKNWWTFTPSSRFPKATNIPSSRICRSSRALPKPKEIAS